MWIWHLISIFQRISLTSFHSFNMLSKYWTTEEREVLLMCLHSEWPQQAMSRPSRSHERGTPSWSPTWGAGAHAPEPWSHYEISLPTWEFLSWDEIVGVLVASHAWGAKRGSSWRFAAAAQIIAVSVPSFPMGRRCQSVAFAAASSWDLFQPWLFHLCFSSFLSICPLSGR